MLPIKNNSVLVKGKQNFGKDEHCENMNVLKKVKSYKILERITFSKFNIEIE